MDVLFSFAYATWGTAVARGMCFSEDRLVETLIDDRRVERLLVAETSRSLPIKLLKDRVRKPPQPPTGNGFSLYGPTRLRRSDPTSIRAVEGSFRHWDARLRRVCRRRGLVRPAVITTHPLIAGFAPLEWASSVTYYAYDDLAELPELRRYRPAILEAYRRVRELGRGVAAVSPAILEVIRPTGPGIVVPNGVDPEEWSSPQPAPPWFRSLPGPRLLYVGSLESRVDVEALATAARALPEASFVLVGPLLEPDHFAELRMLSNVHLRPPASRSEVVGLVTAADACLLPHLDSALTRAMSPLKLYEYLAGGAPVAALDLKPIRDVSSRVVLREDLGVAIAEALAMGRAPESDRRAFAEANSWRRRQEPILQLALDAVPDQPVAC
ncbi:MAG TPA: glycosyltransferase [Solirubrobacterales bacterium]|nr:glycosyltransferase [Solirubrobacterales bacterium]